jgi:hypothetical protein
MKSKFVATFSNGQTITRNSDNAYAFAWAIVRTVDGVIERSGFSADRANAAKGAQAYVWSGISARDRKNPPLRRYHVKLAKDLGFASVEAFYATREAEAAAHNAGRRIEIVAL